MAERTRTSTRWTGSSLAMSTPMPAFTRLISTSPPLFSETSLMEDAAPPALSILTTTSPLKWSEETTTVGSDGTTTVGSDETTMVGSDGTTMVGSKEAEPLSVHGFRDGSRGLIVIMEYRNNQLRPRAVSWVRERYPTLLLNFFLRNNFVNP